MAGHQDELTLIEDLPLLAQLNVQVDLMAKQALHIFGEQGSPPMLSPLPGVLWALSICNLPVSTNPWDEILSHLSAQMAIPYWISKGQLTPPSAKLVDWPILVHALSLWPPTYQMWLSKLASGHSVVGTMMHCWKKWDSPRCPICQLSDEDTNHIFECSNVDCTARWHKLTDDI